MVNDFLRYVRSGSLLAAGYEPIQPDYAMPNIAEISKHGTAQNTVMWQFGGRAGPAILQNEKYGAKTIFNFNKLGIRPFRPKDAGDLLALGGATFQAATTGLSIVQGYQQDGLSGAVDSATFQIASNAAVSKYAYTATKAAGITTMTSTGLFMFGARSVGAAIGGGIGQGIGAAVGGSALGIPGAFAGAAFGAAPIQTSMAAMGLMANPAAMGAVGASMYAGYRPALLYGAYTAAQAGYSRNMARRSIQTDGSMAAFMTRNAVTMRSRAVTEIRRSHMNARSALGQEAGFMHTGKNYFSTYR